MVCSGEGIMRASEAIKKLEEAIKKYGDLHIWADSGMTYYQEADDASALIFEDGRLRFSSQHDDDSTPPASTDAPPSTSGS
jgi:hypothetical protein